MSEDDLEESRWDAIRLSAELAEVRAVVAEQQKLIGVYRSEYIRGGVCLVCGSGVLSSGEHLDSERHFKAIEETGPHPAEWGDRLREILADPGPINTPRNLRGRSAAAYRAGWEAAARHYRTLARGEEPGDQP